jgi:hypothetical protein
MHPGGWADWQPSTLTDTGAPVEMTFRSNQPGLELTTEVGNPAADPANRVSNVCKIMSDLGANLPTRALRDVISAAQGDAKLRYGARLGLHHDGKRCHTMLYAELPAAAADLSSLMSPAPFTPVLEELGDRARTTMLGFNGTTKQVTVYWVADGVDRSILPKLTASTNVGPDALGRAIDSLTETANQIALPTRKLGFSYTVPGAQTPQELTLHFSAKHMFGNDSTAEKRARAFGGNTMSAYANLMDIQYDAPAGHMRHGLIAMKARQNAGPILSIGVAAPWHCPYETN